MIPHGSLRVVSYLYPMDRTLFWPAQDSVYAAYMGARFDEMFLRSTSITIHDLRIRIWCGTEWLEWHNAENMPSNAVLARFRAECRLVHTHPSEILRSQLLFTTFCNTQRINLQTHTRYRQGVPS